jgi:valyl-tRNA synthetase
MVTQHLLEKKAFAKHPFLDRRIPIIGDKVLVNMAFGTGAVKVTPAHDPNDYDCGKRNNLEFISILNDDGTLNENAGSFKGLKRFDAREAVIKQLEEKKLYRGSEANPMTVGICSRSKDIIEPRIKPQWWVNCKSMADAAVKAAQTGELEILPSNHRDTWYRWLENIRDWCISRQLWWGHRCPAYLVCIEGEAEKWESQSHWIVARSEKEALAKAFENFPKVSQSKISLKQDPDVLDTWFSSGIFPFSVMGWPEETPDMKTFYPTSLLETGHDILFFWVARMVMMGMQLTGKLPFKQVYLHAMVRDAHGRKMSKSLGNVLDPLDMISGVTLEGLHSRLLEGNLEAAEVEKAKVGQKQDYPDGIPECGTDAMRFALCAYTSQGRDINLDVKRVAAYRNFCNKLWNVIKFAMTNLGTEFVPAASEPQTRANLSNTELWILSRLENTVKSANEGFKNYDFSLATTSIYSFWLYELCDVYLESMKPVMSGSNEDRKQSCRETLYICLDNGLRLLHPFMPFVTEELWQRLPRRKTDTAPSICIASYPQSIPARANLQVENGLKFMNDIIHAVRSLRASFNLTVEKPTIYVNFHNQESYNSINVPEYVDTIAFLSKCTQVNLVLNQATSPEGCATEIVNESCEVYMLIKGLVDIGVEIKKLEQKKTKLQGDYDRILKQTQGPHYHKVPESVKTDNTTKMETIQQEIKLTEKVVESYKKFS